MALLAVSVSVGFFGPSGIVIPAGGRDNSGNVAHWHLCRLPPGAALVPGTMSWRGQEAGCESPGIDGQMRGHSIHQRVPPGRYLVTTGSPSCFGRATVTVSPHLVATPQHWQAMSCSIQ